MGSQLSIQKIWRAIVTTKMPWINFNHATKLWEELGKDDEKPDTAFFIDGIRRKYLDQVKKDLKNDLDHVEVIVGAVGSGKSTLARLDCRYVGDEDFHPKTHIMKDVHDIKPVIGNDKKQVGVVSDEGSGIFSATDTMTKKTKYASYILDVCRQKNLFIVICAPSLHRLTSSVAVDRATTCTRVYMDSRTGKRGKFAFYGKRAKEKLYRFAKANYGSLKGAKPKYRGRFSEDKTFTEVYLKMKDDTLNLALDSFGDKEEDRPPKPNEIIHKYRIGLIEKHMDKPVSQMAEMLDVSDRTIERYRREVRLSQSEKLEKFRLEKQLNQSTSDAQT